MKQKKQFGPKELRNILIFMFFTVLIGGAGLFYLGLGVVRDYSVEVNQRLADANESGNQVGNLQALKSQLAQSNELVAKANQLFSTPESYQSQALTDVKRYADISGLSIESTSFDTNGGGHTIKVKLKNPVSYKNLIAFLQNVEGNLPKLQVTTLSLARSNAPNTVTVQDIIIEVSVK